MKTAVCLVGGLGLVVCAAVAQDEISLPDIVQGVQEFAQQNLDTNILAMVPDAQRREVNEVLGNLQERLRGEYVIDLAALKAPAEGLVPILESYPELQPYMAWLKSRLDYLQVADDFRIATQPLPKTKVPANPPAAQEREIWVRKVAGKPEPVLAQKYLPQLKPLFADAGIPQQLVWLAEVESSFDARAKSPSGAAGMFQLMPDTARRFGLSLWPRDERLNTDSCARVSARYLHVLYERFGNWPLALAAYNAGEGTVEKLLHRHNARSYDAVATHLPAETQLFVPKLEALLEHREGIKLNELPSIKTTKEAK